MNPADEVALEGPERLAVGLALGAFALEEGAGLRMDAGLGHGDPVEGAVELAVAAAVETVAVAGPRGRGQGRHSCVAGQLRVGREASRASDLRDQLGRGERAAAGQLEQLGRLLADPGLELALERPDSGV